VDIVSESVWVMASISTFRDFHPIIVSCDGIILLVIALLGNDSLKVVQPTLRTITNLTSGTDETTQAVIDAGILRRTEHLLNNVSTCDV